MLKLDKISDFWGSYETLINNIKQYVALVMGTSADDASKTKNLTFALGLCRLVKAEIERNGNNQNLSNVNLVIETIDKHQQDLNVKNIIK